MQTPNFQWKMMDGMRRMSGHIEHHLHPFCTQNGITTLQLTILMTLHFEGPQTVSRLAKRTCMAGANSSALCKRLEKDGLVYRRRDIADERQVQISLTPKGHRVTHQFMDACKGHEQKLRGQLSQEEARCILEGIETLLRVLEAGREEDII